MKKSAPINIPVWKFCIALIRKFGFFGNLTDLNFDTLIPFARAAMPGYVHTNEGTITINNNELRAILLDTAGKNMHELKASELLMPTPAHEIVEYFNQNKVQNIVNEDYTSEVVKKHGPINVRTNPECIKSYCKPIESETGLDDKTN